jgi:hypothetical protein
VLGFDSLLESPQQKNIRVEFPETFHKASEALNRHPVGGGAPKKVKVAPLQLKYA